MVAIQYPAPEYLFALITDYCPIPAKPEHCTRVLMILPVTKGA